MNEKKLLIIDDETLIVENLSEFFESAKWKVETASSGLEAIKKISFFKPSVIISDINMAEMSGLELLAYLDAMGSTIPVILITGYRDVSKMQQAWENSVFDFLDKPFENDHLLNVAESALEFGPSYVTAARARQSRIRARKAS